MRYLLVLCFLSIAFAAEWKIIDRLYSSLFDYGIASNNSDYFHLAICKDGEFDYLYYMRLNYKDNNLYRHGFGLYGKCKSAQVSAHGNRIFIVYQVVQTCPIGAFSCSNIYLVESSNYGTTWHYPILVNLNNTNVSYNYNPLLVQDPNTGDIWIAYKHFSKENPTTIYVASKKAGTRVFTNAPVAVTNQSTIIPGGLSFARTEGNSLSKLQLAWEVKDEETSYLHKIYYSRSSNGEEWVDPVVVAETNLWDHVSPFTLASSGPYLHLVFTRTDGANRGIWATYTNDQGEHWTPAKRLSVAESHLSISAQICSVQGKRRLYILSQDQILDRGYNTFGYNELDTNKMTWLPHPYYKEIKDCYTPHVVCNDKVVMMLCKANFGKQRYELLYLTRSLLI